MTGIRAFVVLLGLAPVLQAQEPQRFLSTHGTLTPAEIALVEGGSVVVKALPTPVKNELAILGAVRVRATTEFFLRMYRDIERFETGWGVTKKVSSPPKLEDFAALSIPEEDWKSLRDCQPGDCEVKLQETALTHLRSQVDWNAPDAREKVLEFFRQRALEYAAGYLEGGNEKLGVYRDGNKPMAITEEFRGLLQNSPYVMSYRPELHRYLMEYPRASLPPSSGASDFLYWSMVDFGGKPTFRLNHVTLYPLAQGPNETVVIASKQLFFSHYFHTGLELMTLLKDADHPEDGFYFVALNRYRTDLPGGLFGKMAVNVAADSARESTERYLAATQQAIEKYFRDERAR
ncbi:MAG TPA: hypothetical protein VJ921_02690 [Vicinamibacteria bacterium]|nr:hypothetical protein [Vicinamibacteria bacterium]